MSVSQQKATHSGDVSLPALVDHRLSRNPSLAYISAYLTYYAYFASRSNARIGILYLCRPYA